MSDINNCRVKWGIAIFCSLLSDKKLIHLQCEMEIGTGVKRSLPRAP